MNKVFRFCTWSAMIIMPGLAFVSCTPGEQSRKAMVSPHVVKACIKIRNDSRRSLAIGVDGPEQRFIKVPPRTRLTVYLKPGVYKYAIAARDTDAITGSKTFASKHIYTWNFGVSLTHAD